MLTVENISYKIGKKSILKNISFKAEIGQMIGILGSNGAGKSSLLKLISKENNISTGDIQWKNRSIVNYDVREMALERAILTQQTYISNDFPVHEIVMMGRYIHFNTLPQNRDWRAVEYAMLQTKTAIFNNRNYQTLSGGEKQRVQLARTLAQIDEDRIEGAKLFLLDEPLNNLDIKHQHHCLQLARKFARMGNVVLIVMHDINLASFYADKILLLNNGEMQSYGSPEQVLTEQNLVQAYDFPVSIQRHPFSKCPIAFFGQKERDVATLH